MKRELATVQVDSVIEHFEDHMIIPEDYYTLD
jgi:hypothetical protein